MAFRRAKGSKTPYWTPQEGRNHPPEIQGVVTRIGFPIEGAEGMKERSGFEIEMSDHTLWIVPINAVLEPQVSEENIDVGMIVKVTYDGQGKAKKGRNPANLFTLYVDE